MRFLDLTLASLAENVALDEALLLQAEAGEAGEALRSWEWPEPAIVLGAGCRLAEDVNEAACRADGVPILRRASGGGTVLLGGGCLLYTLILAYHRSPQLRGIKSSYGYILEKIAAALTPLQPGIAWQGTSDLTVAGRKFSGNAQQRKRHYLLHHGSLLYAFALELVDRYLHMPTRRPEYRQDRSHEAFLTNLSAKAVELKRQLQTLWAADLSPTHDRAAMLTGRGSESSVRDAVSRLVKQLCAEKYEHPDWIRRR